MKFKLHKNGLTITTNLNEMIKISDRLYKGMNIILYTITAWSLFIIFTSPLAETDPQLSVWEIIYLFQFPLNTLIISLLIILPLTTLLANKINAELDKHEQNNSNK